jgi:hypothetical protein
MAFDSTPPTYVANTRSQLLADPTKYSSLADFIDPSKPDNRDLLVKTYGDQGITGFLQLTGAVKASGTNDEVQYWEEGRLHQTQTFTTIVATSSTSDNNTYATLTFGGAAVYIQKNDVIMTNDNVRWIVVSVNGTTDAVVARLDGSLVDGTTSQDYDDASAGTTAIILGNMYAQGSEQPTKFNQPSAVKRTNPYMIVKGNFEVSGSQATNIGWVDLGGGEYRWYIKGEQDTRKRFMDHRELMMLFAEKFDGQSGVSLDIDGDINGSEGYFAAVENRGIVCGSEFLTNPLSGLSGTAAVDHLDTLIFELDKQGAPAEYAMYLNRATELGFDDMLANGLSGSSMTAGVTGQFGAFNNDKDMAIQLGFKTATRGGYTFHKHSWKLLNDPTLAGAVGTYKGAMVPLTTVTDAGTGTKAPALELNYKAVNGYNRELEHWVTGGGVLGFNNNTKDTATFSYRSEIALVTRAANQHVIIKD